VETEEKINTFIRPRAKRNGKRKIIHYRIPQVDNRWEKPPGIRQGVEAG
jgi:hypothetical protein